MLIACTRICECLGRDFLPYMSAVMPFFIQCAQLEPAITKFAESDKATACFMLCKYIYILKEDFYPWINQVVSVFVPLLKFYTQNEVRKHAVKAMYGLLRYAKLAVDKGSLQGGSESYVTKLSDYIIQSLIEALHEEPMTEICASMLAQLNGCLQICRPCLIEGQLRRIVDEVKHVITESSNRKRKLKGRAKSEDFDAEEDELLREEKEQEDDILVPLCRLLETLIKILKGAFLPFFDELSYYLIPMWGKDKTAQERCTPTYIFASLVRECPEVTLRYCDAFLPLFLDASNDECPVVRQFALNGLGLYAEYGGSVFKHFIIEAISKINAVIMHFRAREPENECAHDSAVSALVKICQFHSGSSDSSQKKMSSGEFLNIEPLELDFPFNLKRQVSCFFHLSNKTENHVAFKVKTTNPGNYRIRPITGIVLPGSTCDVIVTMRAHKEAPSDMQCKDKFLVQSVAANPGTTRKDITQEMFNKEAGRVVDECMLRVIYLPQPRPPSPVAEGSEEGPPTQSMKDNDHQDWSEVIPI